MDNDSELKDSYTVAVAAVLTEAKEASKKSLSDLVAETDLSRATIVRVLAGTRDITANYLNQLSRAFGISAGDVLDEAERRDSGK
ncbi:helix-turn-helix transcriptional regulator [Subtercola sp. RTI3]|uniref:helix-turn-helix transcriptional regulator n=1 Tax=Subtercola sp. RTI3 TaxID=3048639 RepID=UPI002B236383|nr:helix-turn-helix transcriptional regulator [Subtercola sp. RTI3]MEA9983696.1 helix-turn-helix transcriptional regulator [Subtercola sp. RTI3]